MAISTGLQSMADAFGQGFSMWIVKSTVKLMGAFGVVLVTAHYAVGPLFDMVTAQIGIASGPAMEWIELTRIQDAIEILSSAYTMRAAKRAFFGKANAN